MRLARSGWVPAVLALVLVTWFAGTRGGVSLRDLTAFVVYLGVLITFPGTMLWRWLSSDPRPLAEDLALGTALGFVLELPVYLVGRWLGLPLLALAIPIAALVLLMVGRRRGRSRPAERAGGDARPGPRASLGASWSLAALVVWSYLATTVRLPLERFRLDDLRAPYVDEPFHLAMATELRHHFPSEVPYVDGVPLYYHWFVYGHVASSSWLTGIESIALVRVLMPSALVLLTILATAAAVRRLTGRAWPGVAAAAVLTLASVADVFGFTPALVPWAGNRSLVWGSPTSLFACLLVVPLTVLIVQALRGSPFPPRRWAVVILLIAVAAGAKATLLPVVIGGLVVVLLSQLVLRRSVELRALGLLAAATAMLLLAGRLVYGGSSRALNWGPLALPEVLAERLFGAEGEVSGTVTLVVSGCYLLAHGAVAAAALGLAARGGWRDPDAAFLLGTVAAGYAAALVLTTPGFNQLYFQAAVVPVVAMAAGLGLDRVVGQPVGRVGRYRTLAGVLLASAAAGTALALGVAGVSGARGPAVTTDGSGASASVTLWDFVWPQLVVVVAVAALAVGERAARRRRALPTYGVSVVVVALLFGLGLPRAVAITGDVLRWTPPAPAASSFVQIGEGGIDAARWLRTRSTSDDLVATNVHCYAGYSTSTCTHQSFWIAGYTERRVLVQGWAYIAAGTVGLPSTPLNNSPALAFWDPQRLADNDAAFHRPSEAALDRLREQYGVDWLLVDVRDPQVRRSELRALTPGSEVFGDYLVVGLRDGGARPASDQSTTMRQAGEPATLSASW